MIAKLIDLILFREANGGEKTLSFMIFLVMSSVFGKKKASLIFGLTQMVLTILAFYLGELLLGWLFGFSYLQSIATIVIADSLYYIYRYKIRKRPFPFGVTINVKRVSKEEMEEIRRKKDE